MEEFEGRGEKKGNVEGGRMNGRDGGGKGGKFEGRRRVLVGRSLSEGKVEWKGRWREGRKV